VTSTEDLESLEQRIKLEARRRAEVLQKPAHARPNLRNVYVAPRNEAEQKIASLWEGLLGTQLGVHDSFMELGGDSMLAVQLISRISRTFGINLRLGNLFETPTVAGLAETLERMRSAASGPSNDSAPGGGGQNRRGKASVSSSPLVGLQTEGPRRPFFCVHPSGGNVFCFVNLARHLGYDQPFYGLQARGLAQGEQPSARIEEMAAHYVEALRAVQPSGPYLLGGWSLGGIVAFEMAQQLRGGGHEVELLALIDVAASVCSGDVTEVDDTASMVSFAHELVNTWGANVPVETFQPLWGGIESVASEARLDYILRQAQTAGIIPADVELPDGQQLLRVFMSNMRAGRAYSPQPYPGHIKVIRAAESAGETPDATLGWGALAQGGVESHTAPGNHYSMMREPHVRELAHFLKHSLDGVNLAETLEQSA
jgi:thioesterase domain-containing protein/acyl carrier protein